MTFSVYNKATGQLVVEIEDNTVYIHRDFEKALEKIPVDACFAYIKENEKKEIDNERERLFGKATYIDKHHPHYPTALEMYCRTQFLTHPESYYEK